jgi:hypothetical protein
MWQRRWTTQVRVAGALALLGTAAVAQDFFWDIATIEDGYQVGQFTSLAILSSGEPAISYYDYMDGDLEYAWYDGSEWHTETVDSQGDVGAYSKLAILPTGQPAIVYFDNTNDRLRYAWYDGSTWRLETVAAVGSVQPWCSLAILPSGQPAVSYGSGNIYADRLTYAERDPDGIWWTTEVDDSGDVGGYTSLVIFPTDHPEPNLQCRPAISYYDWGNGDLKFAWVYGTEWHTAVIAETENVGQYTSLAIFPADHANPAWRGQPAISYFDDTNDDLKYAWHEDDYDFETGWQTTIVDGQGEVNAGSHTSLAILPSGRSLLLDFDGERSDLAAMPVISYHASTPAYDLKFAWFDGEAWRSVVVDDVASAGYYTSMVILPSGDPAISYFYHNWNDTRVKYARFQAFGWRVSTADQSRIAGVYTSMAILPATGQPAISYLADWPDYDLVYAEHQADDTWQTHIVDDDRGAWTSLAILPGSGEPAISYSGGGLWYAERDPDDHDVWQTAQVDTTGADTSLAIFPADHPAFPGQPAISYLGNADLRFAVRDANEPSLWDVTVVDSAWDLGYYTSLAIFPLDHPDPDLQGQPTISYFDSTNYDLKYACCKGDPRNPDDWHTITVDTVDHVGECTSLAIFPTDHQTLAGQPAISYYDHISADLRFAWCLGDPCDPDAWRSTTVDDETWVGWFTSLAILPSGQPAISYRDDWNNTLKFAWHLDGDDFSDPSTWRTAVVDDTADATYTSLAVLPSGQPAISYFDDQHWDLKFAKFVLTGDVNSDCTVDQADLGVLLAKYGTPGGATYEDGDLDGDGDVDQGDLGILLAHWGEGCP